MKTVRKHLSSEERHDRAHRRVQGFLIGGLIWVAFGCGILGWVALANAQTFHLPPSKVFTKWESNRTFGDKSTVLVDVYSANVKVPRIGGLGCAGWFLGYGTILRASVCGHDAPLKLTYRSRSPLRIYVKEFPNGA